ncbi:uncharacterized protein DDB_G0283697-like isoform X2 [Mytilus trossulus]|uniref:uncharacterized protein DDB_G0283697-like isoform X2 n=1 Tax=Mytilus trossulus TaxID=6551 RepID=UPI00300605E8
MKTMCNTYLYLLYLFISSVTCYDVTNSIDFEGNGCNTQLMVGDNTIAEVIATPQAGVLPDSSKCEAKFQAIPADRKLKIYMKDFFMGPGACGHKLKIYDGVEFVSQDPKWEFSCNTEIQDVYTSSTNQVIIAFTKPSVDTSQLYRFKIHLTTDRAAPLGSAGDAGDGGITSGAIAGIAVGAVVGVVIIIAICIYLLWKFMRQAEEKKRYVAEPPPAISVISAPPLSNCGIAPGSSRRSFRSQSHVAFSTVSKKSDPGDSISKSRSQKSFDNHGFSQDGTSVSSSLTRTENSKDNEGAGNTNYKSEYKEDLKMNHNLRRSTGKDKKEEKINYPDVVDSARKSEKNRPTKNYDEDDFRNTKSRSDSVRRSEKEKSRHRSDSMKRGDFRERSESAGRDKERGISRLHKHRNDNDYSSDERDRERYNERDQRPQKHERNQTDRHQKYRQSDKHKTESVNTDDSGTTYISSVSDRYHERNNRRTDKQENRRYPNDRKYRDDRQNEHRHCDERYDDRRYGDDRNYRDRYSEKSSSQRQGRSDMQSRKNHDLEEREFERRRSRREESGRQRSHSSSHQGKYSDHDRYRDRDQRSHFEDERNSGLRRRESSRSQSGRHRSRSSYR